MACLNIAYIAISSSFKLYLNTVHRMFEYCMHILLSTVDSMPGIYAYLTDDSKVCNFQTCYLPMIAMYAIFKHAIR